MFLSLCYTSSVNDYIKLDIFEAKEILFYFIQKKHIAANASTSIKYWRLYHIHTIHFWILLLTKLYKVHSRKKYRELDRMKQLKLILRDGEGTSPSAALLPVYVGYRHNSITTFIIPIRLASIYGMILIFCNFNYNFTHLIENVIFKCKDNRP